MTWDCRECILNNEDAMTQYVTKYIYNLKKDFFSEYWGGDCIIQNEVIKRGQCWNAGVPCSDEYCCSKFVTLCFDENGNLTLTYEDTFLYTIPLGQTQYVPTYCYQQPINCQNGQVVCDGTLFHGYIGSECDVPCNVGNWSPVVKLYFDLPMCGGNCRIYVSYYYRTATCGEVQYYDYMFDYAGPAAGSTCDLNCIRDNHVQVYSMALGEILRNGKHDVPVEPNKCIDQYRFLTMSCLTWDNEFQQLHYCLNSSCCWKTFRLCNDQFGHLLPPIETGSGGYYPPTCDASHPCDFVCDFHPRISLNDNFNDPGLNNHFQETNIEISTKNGIEFKINSNDFEYLKLEIFDYNGIRLFSESQESINGIFNIKLDLNNYKSGIYLYIIKSGGLILKNGTFPIL